ncbi:MAG: PaaI family thioesterase [Alphaproteobacteria bacterium]|nr:PaaI family thioesterase [Alphaproteobacteria bacterium]
MPFADHLVGNPSLPAIHGGTLGALLEASAIVQVLWDAPAPVLPKTINLTVEYLRSGGPADTFARSTITRHGRRVIHVRSETWQEDPGRPIALGHLHLLVEG